MSITGLLSTPCTVITPEVTGEDSYGNDTITTVERATRGHFQPVTSEELAERPDGNVRWRGWFRPDTQGLTATAAVDVPRLGTFQIVGPPRPWAAPGGPTVYVEVDLSDRGGS